MSMFRILINADDEEKQNIYDAMDENGIDYDFDDGDRILVDETYLEETTELLDEYGLDYDII